MRMLLLVCLGAAWPSLLPAATPPPAAAASPVAVVASVHGPVVVAGARGGSAPAAFGRALERGDKLTVGPGGGAVLFFSDGNVVTLAERSSVTIGGRVAPPSRGNALPGDVFAQVSHFATAGSRQTGLVAMADMRSDADAGEPVLLAPRNTALLDGAPTFRWRTVPGAARYRVHVGAASGDELWAHEVPAAANAEPSLPYPADAARLAAGGEYRWEVEALDDKGTLRREEAFIRVLPAETSSGVLGNLARIAESAGGAETTAGHFLAGSYLSGLGLYADAATRFQALATLAPAAPAPHEALGDLYLAVGLPARAATEYQRALALQRVGR
jgi:hypothetical protein